MEIKSFEKPAISLYSDGAHNPRTGGVGYASVVDSDKKDMIAQFMNSVEITSGLELKRVSLPVGERQIAIASFTDVTHQQNNGAELIGMLMALRMAVSGKCRVETIYCDSTTVLAWSQGRIGSATKLKMDKRKIGLIEECHTLRSLFEKEFKGQVLFVPGDDNPADLGFHRSKSAKNKKGPKPTLGTTESRRNRKRSRSSAKAERSEKKQRVSKDTELHKID